MSMNLSSADFRELPKYYGDVVPVINSPYAIGSSSSRRFFAFNYANNTIGYLPIDFSSLITEKPAEGRRKEYGSKVCTVKHIPTCNNKLDSDINNISFNPFDHYLLASAHSNGIVQLWKLPSDNSYTNVDSPLLNINNLSNNAISLKYHYYANNILAIGGNKSIFITDIETGKIIYNIDNIDCNEIVSLDWNKNGGLLRGISKDSKILSLDPRTKPNTKDIIIGTTKLVPENIINLSNVNDNFLLISGLNDFKEPVVNIVNTANFDKPIFEERYDHKNCRTLVHYDHYTNLVYLTFRTTADLLIYEIKSNGTLEKFKGYHSENIFMSMTVLPKVNCKKREINKIIKVGKDRSQLLPHVLNKTLYEETIDNKPLLTSSEYINGNNNNNTEFSEVVLFTGEEDEKEERKTSVYLHCNGKEPLNFDDHYTHLITGDLDITLGQNIKTNKYYGVFPSKATGGGSLGVIDLRKLGRQKQKEIRGHKDKITTFDISRLNDNIRLVATGSTDAKVFVWEIPSDSDWENNEPVLKLTLQHQGKITFVGFHPLVPDILITADKAMDSVTLYVWDINSNNIDNNKKIEWSNITNQAIVDLQFDLKGNLSLLSSQDKKVRIIDIRNKLIIKEFEPLENMRDIKVFWCDNDCRIITLGFGKGSVRRFSIWNIKNDDKELLKPDCEKSLDTSNAIPIGHYDNDCNLFYVTSINDRKIRIYEIDNNNINELLGSYTTNANNSEILGFSFKNKLDLDIKNVEINKCFKLSRNQISPISFIIPRKRKEYFQDDLYPDTININQIIMDSNDWFNNKLIDNLIYVSLQPNDMTLLSDAPPEKLTEYQKKRLSMDKKLESDKLKQQPRSAEQAFEQFGRMVADAPTQNRWDAQNIGTEVDENEWDD